MSAKTIYIPFSRQLYDDVVRFSDGKIDVAAVAEEQVTNWIVRTLTHVDFWPDHHFEEAASKYAPDLLESERMRKAEELAARLAKRQPLIWKLIAVPHGSDVRMSYNGKMHFARVEQGQIVDADGAYSPSAWASKVADNTKRNAWRDIWFKKPRTDAWVRAEDLREAAIADLDLSDIDLSDLAPKTT